MVGSSPCLRRVTAHCDAVKGGMGTPPAPHPLSVHSGPTRSPEGPLLTPRSVANSGNRDEVAELKQKIVEAQERAEVAEQAFEEASQLLDEVTTQGRQYKRDCAQERRRAEELQAALERARRGSASGQASPTSRDWGPASDESLTDLPGGCEVACGSGDPDLVRPVPVPGEPPPPPPSLTNLTSLGAVVSSCAVSSRQWAVGWRQLAVETTTGSLRTAVGVPCNSWQSIRSNSAGSIPGFGDILSKSPTFRPRDRHAPFCF